MNNPNRFPRRPRHAWDHCEACFENFDLTFKCDNCGSGYEQENAVTNPNNCGMCKHKANPEEGWCYMFKDEPEAICLKHSARDQMTVNEIIEDLEAMKRRREVWIHTTKLDLKK